ncbi:hypothetical protein U1Q18_023647 [Sarracenia purpurea var. burkii]
MNRTNLYDANSLDDFFRDYVDKNTPRFPRTRILYNITVPANFTAMEVSVLRLRAMNFWHRGANISFFQIPPRILPVPFVRRFDLIYLNLGNWSSYYYNVPNYTLVAPVVGILFYNATNPKLGNVKLNLWVNKDPILVHFPHIVLSDDDNNMTMQCVRFDPNGSVELTNTTVPGTCIARNYGHFSIVVPSLSSAVVSAPSKKKDRCWKWWVVGFGVGVVGLVLVWVVICKFVKWRRIGKMQRQSERGEALGSTWVGRSKMPSATWIRTQPVLENDYAP